MSAEVSPDSKCPICLDLFDNVSYLDICFHKFCFRCIHEWSKNKAQCPLCKQPFNSIYHSIESEQNFKKYDLQPPVDNTAFWTFGGDRWRYRTRHTGVQRQMRGRTSPPNNRVMFKAAANRPQQLQDRYVRRMMMRLAAKSLHNQKDSTQGEVNNEECQSYDSDDCAIIFFVKSAAERTPELVQLSSDSDESASEDIKALTLRPQHIRSSSLSPVASQSRDPSDAEQNVETDHHHPLDTGEGCSSSLSTRYKTSSKSNRKDGCRERHKDHRRKRRSGSAEHRSRSPLVSYSSVNTVSRERGCSYSRDYSNCGRDSDRSYQSYRHYGQKRNDGGILYTEKKSYYYSSCKYSDRRSRSRSRRRDSRRRDGRRSHSRTSSSSHSPSTKSKSHNNKPGGKREYKTRHLEEASKTALSNSNAECDTPVLWAKQKKKGKEKHPKKSKDGSGKTSGSLSIELVNEENSQERSKRQHEKKKKHNEHTERTPSPTVITIDSDSESC